MILTKVETILFLPGGSGCINSGVIIQHDAKNESALMGKNDRIVEWKKQERGIYGVILLC